MEQNKIKVEGRVSHHLGALSEHYESGGRGPGAVSGGQGDPGGVSYGLYQLASRIGTVADFIKTEGARWSGELADTPASPAFSAAWKAIAARDGVSFARAQQLFIERSHYRPVVAAVRAATGLDLDRCADAVRDACWSAAVQHGAAARLLIGAVGDADGSAARGTMAHDRAIIEAAYRRRSAYVSAIAEKSSAAVRRTLKNVVEKRYPHERSTALAMLG